MRELISLHLGQAGINIGNSCWELFCMEHDLNPDGTSLSRQAEASEPVNSFFYESRRGIPGGKVSPRALFADLDPDLINEMRSCDHPMRGLHPAEQLVNGPENAGNIFHRGRDTLGKGRLVDVCVDRIRRLAEGCDSLQGFLLFRSLGGGTGSGFTSLLMEKLSVEYRTKHQVDFCVYPTSDGELSSSTAVEVYNAVLASPYMFDLTDMSVMLENEAISEMCWRLGIKQPALADLNRLIGQLVSSATTPLRFPNDHSPSLADYRDSLVPAPRLSTIIASYAPILTAETVANSPENMSTSAITRNLTDPMSMFLKCDPRNEHEYMGMMLMYRGDTTPKEVNAAVQRIKSAYGVKFAEWVPTGVSAFYTSKPPAKLRNAVQAKVPRAACMLANSTAVSEAWSRLCYKFDGMYAKRAFIHFYAAEGMEEEEMAEARENLALLEADYEDLRIQREDSWEDSDEVY